MSGDLLDRLFAQARQVVMGERDRVSLDFQALAQLVSDPALQARFRTRFRLEAQNAEVRELILLLLKGVASKAGEAAEHIDADVEGLASYVGQPALGLLGAAIASMVASGGLVAFLLLAGGVVAAAGGGIGSLILKRRAIRLRSFADRVRLLIEDLE